MLKRYVHRKEFEFQQKAYGASSRYFLEPVFLSDHSSLSAELAGSSDDTADEDDQYTHETGILSQVYPKDAITLGCYMNDHKDHADALRTVLDELKSAIDALNAHSIQHGDLDAQANILVKDEHVVIIDFDRAEHTNTPVNKIFDYPASLPSDLRTKFAQILQSKSVAKDASPGRKKSVQQNER